MKRDANGDIVIDGKRYRHGLTVDEFCTALALKLLRITENGKYKIHQGMIEDAITEIERGPQ